MRVDREYSFEKFIGVKSVTTVFYGYADFIFTKKQFVQLLIKGKSWL